MTRGRNAGDSAVDDGWDLGGAIARGFWMKAAEQVFRSIQVHKKVDI